ncbi:hypothetical protein HIM_06094 [Hirsutella minnesotensis 3608]|uniref:DNA topoisomerase (ATP-hydrolyzing) n=1 Tax=Hirsutella minnesotensis 3608 TaxID=1043627 RepID=A0A0F7ZUA0_9HYPO|nr:hypothetical protein HIM_06094 [Hirsutella minnesotensis 3608]
MSTRSQIFYQHQELFEKQRVVDELVDDLALTFGVHRDALNIVASAKGLIFGPLTIRFNDDTTAIASVGDVGTPVPSIRSISTVSCQRARWILVIEKDATFRTLTSSRYHETSAIGPGLLVTAKGYPDVMTQSFLQYMHEHSPRLPILVLTDFDPDGLNIFRCYRFGADAGAADPTAQNPGVRHLGVNARHIQDLASAETDVPESSQFTQQGSSQSSSQGIASRTAMSSNHCRDPVTLLTSRDRRLASSILVRLSSTPTDDPELDQLKRELQVMLMLGVKAEIQWLDDAGDLAEWLDENIAQALSLFAAQI